MYKTNFVNHPVMEAVALKTVKYLEENFPKKKLVMDKMLNAATSDIWGFNTIKIYVREVGNELHFKTSINNLNKYLS